MLSHGGSFFWWCALIYNKQPLTTNAQVDLLLQRGMLGDPDQIRSRLEAVNYYRLSGYWYPFRNPDDTFKAGTTFEKVWERYAFDRRLRLLVMDAIERIEIAVRSQLAYHHAHLHGAFGYAVDPTSLPKLAGDRHAVFVGRVREETGRSHERFVRHFAERYGDTHQDLPVWMATEVMSFGTVLTFYRSAPHQVKRAIADVFGMPDMVFSSWLLTLNTVRNICAHHSRLWNRESGVKPLMPRVREYPDWHAPVVIENNRIFAVLTICRHCLARVAPQSNWAIRMGNLFREFPAIPQGEMGFPANWKACPIWM